MLSICIPIYNYDCRKLINDLIVQINQLGIQVEIFLLNDGSDEKFDIIYKDFKSGFKNPVSINYTCLPANRGRAFGRNYLAQVARFDLLLFLDCDSEIINTDFLKTYIDKIDENFHVLCGGRQYPELCNSKSNFLHWKYGKFVESKTLKERILFPYKSFMTNNFLIRKNVFEKIKFDESLSKYGHEDTLFGYYLEKKGLNIKHIHNPILHGSIESNEIFLKKTEEAVQNLVGIIKKLDYDPMFYNSVSLSKIYFKFKSLHLTGILNIISKIFIQPLKKLIINNKLELKYFALLKLLLFTRFISR